MNRMMLLLAAMLPFFLSCEPVNDDPEPEDDTLTATVSGHTLTCKTSTFTHTYTLDEGEDITTLTFTHFPASVEEFTALRSKLLGSSRPGTVALCLISFEMYRRDCSAGEQCVQLINTSANATITLPRLKEKFPSQRGQQGDSYTQPYLVASYLKGATQSNKYTPSEPYVLTMKWNDNSNVVQGEYSSSYSGRVYHYYALWNGDGKRDATVLVPDNGGDVIVHGCGNLVMGVPTIEGWNDSLK